MLEIKVSYKVSVSNMKQRVSEAYPEPSQTCKMELLMKIVKQRNPLIIFENSSILDVQFCSKYASEFSCKRSLG